MRFGMKNLSPWKACLIGGRFMLQACVVFSSDWPQWRGPERRGVWKEEHFSFPTGPLPVMWKVPCGGGYSSPVTADGFVFLFDSVLQKPRAWERVR